MQETDIRKAVIEAYDVRYKDWQRVSVAAITKFGDSGFLAVAKTEADEDGNEAEEICFISDKSGVLIFENTSELVSYLDRLSSLRNWLYSGQGVAALAFLLILVAFLVLMVFPIPTEIDKKSIFDSLKTILGLAAGYFLANRASSSK